ncbi:COQ9 family protein [Rhodobacteraceae bacterium 2CG4]|uniref:COQ9 family protein n=1 Tax=Halovulum marinum TaxID=2662447 RepID=A0A6L5YXJ9_9RHOB|nr:COQ9 family protein [Halovulum marinum]MSU88555.1 COQ9 family protein [Halovulum marinum]
MTDEQTPTADSVAQVRQAVLSAALPNVAFDGWTDRTLADAVRHAGVDPGLARLAFPRGGVDLALAFHHANDEALAARLETEDLAEMRFSERIAHAIALRLEIAAAEREAVRRAAALFALPIHAADGARAVWHTADTIWTALGDRSDDVNWYTKRMTLSAVYSSCVLYWLGDDSPGHADTRGFIDRRIADVMQVEKVKAAMRDNPLGRAFMAGPGRLLGGIRAPGAGGADLPGRWRH